jgi:hypothetical protein
LETTVLHAPNTFDSHSPFPASLAARVDEWHVWKSILGRYLEGWAEADPAKIADATAQDYDFHDPLVGHFSRRTLPQYFALLRSRFGIAGVAARRDLAFTLRGPMWSAYHPAWHQYWREAPLLGLTGLAEITLKQGYVAAEVVTYDLNMACETLQRSPTRSTVSGARVMP